MNRSTRPIVIAVAAALLMAPLAELHAADLSAPAKIDRHALVTRHNVTLDRYDPSNPLQVGNGEFAFAVDVTGLQTFTAAVGTFSNWGWHTFPNPQGFREEETLREVVSGGGHKANYAFNQSGPPHGTPQQQARGKAAYDWYRRAPHRLHLGRIGFELLRPDGRVATPADLKKIRQTLDLWTGTVHSAFALDGMPVEVITCCHPQQNVVAVQVRSKLLAAGRLRVFWHFPYVEFNNCDPTWKPKTDGRHRSEAVLSGSDRAEISRTLDADRYFVSVAWSDGRWASVGPHRFVLTPSRDKEAFSFVCGFSPRPVGELPRVAETAAASAQHWPQFWRSGGAIDLSASQDPRWRELERRIVLSQYLTAVNSTGSLPPQESGLFSNSWYGKFHLEMTAWHGVHFVLWGRPSLLDGWMQWMRGPGLQSAKRQAAKQGYQGARWMKMIGPDPHWESPSGAGPFRMTQQGHAIYWAELMYRQRPTRETLEQFREIVMQSAEFMADFVWWDAKTGRYVLGPPLLSGSEHTSPLASFNSTVELSYWFYGLRTAQVWRERLGLPREPKWDGVLAKLSKPPVVNGLCADVEPFPQYNGGRPAWLEAYGCMRGDEIDVAAMARSFETIWGDIQGGSRKWQIWGTDFPMLAMTAARLGRPRDAVECLLIESPGNGYQANGFNTAGSRPYLPAHGGLLWAAAMMAAGWEGGPHRPAPGFPDDGRWVVRWEGLEKAP
jgi:hypothetical protein